MKTKPNKIKLCWKHKVELFTAAYGSLLDLSGKMYPARCKVIFANARKCEKCSYPTVEPFDWKVALKDTPEGAALVKEWEEKEINFDFLIIGKTND